MIVDWSTTQAFRDPKRVLGSHAIEATDYTARIDLRDLPAGQHVFYRVFLQSLRTGRRLANRWRVASDLLRPPSQCRFLWSGDTAGQGYGINPDWGGMRTYDAMRRREPDFFLHSGDTIYADGPIPSEVKAGDGTIWKNVTEEA